MILRPLSTTTDGYKLPRVLLFYPIDKLKVRAILSQIRSDFIFHLFSIKSNIFPSSYRWHNVNMMNVIMVMCPSLRFTSLFVFPLSMIRP